MPRNRNPDEVMQLSGAWEKNPKRKRPAAPKAKTPIGTAPTYFNAAERKVWAEIETNSPDGVLTGNDRFAVEVLCRLMAKFRTTGLLTGPELTSMVGLIGRFGMSPADRAKLAALPASTGQKPAPAAHMADTPASDDRAEFTVN